MASSNMGFSVTLQSLRKKQGVTQEQLANYLGVSPQAVSKWENGSYPEGDLLPKISDFFGVSISYLYGQEKEKISIEQEVLDVLQNIMEKHADEGKGGNNHPEYFEKMMDIAWAFQIGCWKNNRQYYNRAIPEKNTRTASVITDDAGFSFFNLNTDNQFYTIVKEPEGGFYKHMKVDELRQFFQLLGTPGALEILFYMLSLNNSEYATASTIAKSTGLDINNVKDILKKASFYQCQSNPCFRSIEVKKTDGVDCAYGIEISSTCLFISLLMNAKVLINTPTGYQMQVGMRGKSWFDTSEVGDNRK